MGAQEQQESDKRIAHLESSLAAAMGNASIELDRKLTHAEAVYVLSSMARQRMQYILIEQNGEQ